MEILVSGSEDHVSRVYVAELRPGKWVEFAEAIARPLPIEKKWVLLVSTLFGCPVRCLMCDAGFYYRGRLFPEEIFFQIENLLYRRFSAGAEIPVEKLKIQFSRLGDPAMNPAVLDVLRALPGRIRAPGLIPSLSTIAPAHAAGFLEELAVIKDTLYPQGRFQMQFSIHTTDPDLRRQIIPVPTWDFDQIARYGERFFRQGDRRITLNFALLRGAPLEADVLARHFDPALFVVKVTPVNPTYHAQAGGLESRLTHDGGDGAAKEIEALRQAGFTVIPSMGDAEENAVGSNCGQSLIRHLGQERPLADGYLEGVISLVGEEVAAPSGRWSGSPSGNRVPTPASSEG